MAAIRVSEGARAGSPSPRRSERLVPGRPVLPVPAPYLGEPRDNAVCVMPCEPPAARMAREVVARTVGGWQTGGRPGLCADVTTVVSELVANACCHGLRQACGEPPWRIVLGLVRTDSHLMCVVSDPGAEPLSLLPLPPDADCGRGLHVVDRTAADWGWHPGTPHTGKIVWACFRYEPSA